MCFTARHQLYPGAHHKKSASEKDHIGLLEDDHLVVQNHFSDYKKTRSVKKKKALVARIALGHRMRARKSNLLAAWHCDWRPAENIEARVHPIG